MRTLIDIAETGFAAILLHPQRSIATVACVVSVLVPYLAGIGISNGLQREAELSARLGADLYVSGNRYGRQSPLALSSAKMLEQLEGVESVTPRIVGSITLGRARRNAVVVGLPVDRLPDHVRCVEGRLFEESNTPELVIGSRLARRLNLKPGDRVPPFYRDPRGDRVATIVGVFQSDLSMWEANLIFTSLETASQIFNQPDRATGFLVHCRPGYAAAVREHIIRTITFPSVDSDRGQRPFVISRDELLARLPAGLLQREGIFNLLFLVAFSVGILVVLVTSGFGLTERRREVALLKATGWQTDQLLIRGIVESLALCVAAASLAIVIAYVWLEWLNGYWIAGVFLRGVGSDFKEAVPFVLTPWPSVLSLIISFVVVMSGSVFSTWRAATASPASAMRN